MEILAKIFCDKRELPSIAPDARLIESYDAFQLVKIKSKDIPSVTAIVPVEDITDQYKLKVAGRWVKTSKPSQKSRKKPASGPHHYLVQFIGPIKSKWLRTVAKAGAEPRGPYGGFTYIFRMSRAVVSKVGKLPMIRWLDHLPYESRIAPGVLAPGQNSDEGGPSSPPLAGANTLPDVVAIQFFSKENLIAARGAVLKAGGRIVTDKGASGLLVVRLPTSTRARRTTIRKLSRVHGVRLITLKTIRSSRNNVATGIMNTAGTIAPPPSGLGLTGDGEIIGIADTGLDTGVAGTVLPDFRGRIKAIYSWPISPSFAQDVTNPGADDGPADVDSGHGTHTSGSAIGGGSTGPGGAYSIKGLSNQAHLVFQAVEQKMKFVSPQIKQQFGNVDYVLAGLPDDLNDLFQQAYDAGARIHSNSWGGGQPKAYADDSRQVDEFIWNNKDFCILIAAGNDGADKHPADGVVDLGSVTPPGTAKNCITVGASESVRPQFGKLTYGAGWPSDYPKNPIKSDPVAKNPDQVAAFSSRGPTDDGRFKPDVVAPGTAILSTRSTQIPSAEQGWGAYAANGNYMFDGGTSMATPLAAGAVGLLRQFFRTVKNVGVPSAALLKATLICGAQRLALPYVPGSPIADNHQGFGRTDLDAVLSPPAGNVFGFKEGPGLNTGNLDETTVTITQIKSGGFRVVMTYSDFPGHGLKNNLNLLVISPSGARLTGNGTPGATTPQFDASNNVEAINVPNPAPGNWRIQVIAANVPQGPQPFALAWLKPL